MVVNYVISPFISIEFSLPFFGCSDPVCDHKPTAVVPVGHSSRSQEHKTHAVNN